MIGPVFAKLDPNEGPVDPQPLPAEGSALDFLQAVYRNSTLPLPTRMRRRLRPYQSPKLSATAVLPGGLDFAQRLEQAMARSLAVKAGEPLKLIEPTA